jgi:hypothetical protein
VRTNFGIGTLGPEHGRVQSFIVLHLCKRCCARLQWAFAGASHPDGSVPPFRALSRYASDTDNSCVSPQWGHSSLSVFFHDARRLCGSVSIPVGTCRPVLGQVNNSSDIRALSCVDVGLGSASALHVKHRSLPSRLPYSACASSRTALALIPSAITALQRSQTSVTLITSSHLGALLHAGG